jgi:hypothetical protein
VNTVTSPEYAAVRHILTAPSLAARCAPHINDDDFAWDALLAAAATMSGGEATLVRVAFDLWEAEGVVGIWELPKQLDARNFERVLEALQLYRGDHATETRVTVAA